MITEVEPKLEESLRTELTTVQKQAAITITDQKSYDNAAEILVTVKTWRKKWEGYWHGSDAVPGPIKLAYKSYKSLLDKFNEGDKPAETAEKTVKAVLLKWDQEQTRIQEEAQRKADEKARQDEDAKKAALAVELEDSGMTEEDIAAAVESVQVEAPVVVEPTFTRATGVSKPRDNWKARVTSVKDLCKHIGAGKLKFDPKDEAKIAEFFEMLLDKRAKADKSTLVIPGVKAYNEPVVAGRAR
jgi:hypothetical protein